MSEITIAENQKLIAKNISEAELQDNIIKLAHLTGWKVHAERPARLANGEYRTAIQGDRGYVDITLAKKGEVLFIECKSEEGRPTNSQTEWALALFPHYYLARPSDWLGGIIERLLRSER